MGRLDLEVPAKAIRVLLRRGMHFEANNLVPICLNSRNAVYAIRE